MCEKERAVVRSVVADGLFRWNTEIYTGCFPADTTNIACVGNTAAVPLAAAGAVRQISGGLQIPLVEDQIAAASAVEPCLPAEVVDCIKQIQRFLPHKQKLPGIEHIVKLGFNLGIQTKSVNLEIAGIRCCMIPGVHRGISEMVTQVIRHFAAGSKVNRLREFSHIAPP